MRSSFLALMALVGALALAVAFAAAGVAEARPQPQQALDPSPPAETVKLIFIHHSTGENWLRDDYGGLGLALSQNNYFVSDTNYGWGPDAIGDRTDIPDWVEWFASDATPRYMDALFNESGQHADYTRSVSDPGGENEIVVFKSCFPNSALEGDPHDPPDPAGWLSVGHVKYVYTEILQYFGARPDKLFVVITAPPLSDGTYAENARAFNNWLLNDWLRENNYALNNVAVFDFYNVLTSPGAHHRFRNGRVEHVIGDKNTLHYPSADDHPSARGSQKATGEFVPLLNVFYHRWQGGGPIALPVQNTTSAPPADATQPPASPPSAGVVGLLDDFEGAPPAGSAGWESYFQDNTDTRLGCAPEFGSAHGGTASLKFEFDAAPNSWATCGIYFDSAQDWSAGQGLSFYLRADRAGIPFDVDLYGGSPGGRSTYVFRTQTTAGSVNEWTLVEIRWADILRVEWEDDPGTPINPAAVTGFSLGLSTPELERTSGTIWIDDLSLLGAPTSAATDSPTAEPSPSGEPASSGGPSLPCVGSLILPLFLVEFVLWQKRPRNGR